MLPKPPLSTADRSLLTTRKEWSSAVMPSTGKGAAIFLWCFAIFWCAVSVPGNFFIAAEIAKGNYATLAILLFDLVGVALIFSAARQTVAWRKFGNVTLTLDPYPGSISGHVGGVIDAPQGGVNAATVFTLELACMRISTNGSGKDAKSSHTALWQDTRKFSGKPYGDGAVEVPFCFDVPDDLPFSSAASINYYSWTLRISCALEGIDFVRQWDIPVLDSGKQASAVIAQTKPVVSAADTDAQLHIEQGASGLAMDYPAGRSVSAALSLGVIAAILGGAAWFMAHNKNPAPLFMVVIFVLVTLLMAIIALWLLGNALRVEVRAGSLFINRSVFFIPVWSVEVPLSRIEGITYSKGMSSSSGSQTKVYYRLVIKTVQSDTYIVGDGFVGYSAVMEGAKRLAKLTGLKLLDG